MKIYYYFKRYPLSLLVVSIIGYLSFFTPPQTELDEINNFDKLAHIGMYGGFSFIIWLEYLRSHKKLRRRRLAIGAVILPLLLSGIIELLQAYCTENRSGDWFDLLANSTGVVLASIVGYYILRPYCNKRHIRKTQEKDINF
ncbi:MAG: VanZ family protein [Phocaeicola sp.]